MPHKTLPSHPSLDHLKSQARDLLAGQRAARLDANQRIREFHPSFRGSSDAEISSAKFALADAYLTIAREYAFASWPKLKAFVTSGQTWDSSVPLIDRIPDPIFREGVRLLDAGDEEGLRRHLVAHPSLVSQRTYFSASDYFGQPTLMQFAAENPIRHEKMPPNVVAMVSLLLEAGAKATDGTLGLVVSGRVPRECGVQISLIDLLCAHGADPSKALSAALGHGEFEAVEALLRNGAPMTLPTAAALGRLEDVRQLLPTSKPAARHLALALGAQFGRTPIVRLLLESGEDPNRYNPPGAHAHSTPLHQAALAGHMEVVDLLLKFGARTDIEDILFHGTPLGWARHAGNKEMEERLLRPTAA